MSRGATESEMWIDELGWLDSILYDEKSESLLICLQEPKGKTYGSVQGASGEKERQWRRWGRTHDQTWTPPSVSSQQIK